MMRRSVQAAIVAAAMVVIFAPAVGADAPTKTYSSAIVPFEIVGVCSFPIEGSALFAVTETDFVDQSGALVGIHLHIVEQDTLMANGITIVGEPYTGNIDLHFENGVLVRAYSAGIPEKLRLPDGRLFIVAGRKDILNSTGFLITVDNGNPGDVAALCAALTP
jgi:hypothetical protein